MLVFNELNTASVNSIELENFLNRNFQRVYDFLSHQKYGELNTIKSQIRKYILTNGHILRQLNVSVEHNLAFIGLLLEVSERFGFLMEFRLLYEYLKEQKYVVGVRIEASSLFLMDIKNGEDYITRFDDILSKLNYAFENEEDNDQKVITTMVNYYSSVLNNFAENNLKLVERLRAKIIEAVNHPNSSYLNNDLINSVISIDPARHQEAYTEIHSLLDEFLGKTKLLEDFNLRQFLIEIDTEYSRLLGESEKTFISIKKILKDHFQPNDRLFRSLQRGVGVLLEEAQLLQYMYSYGNMHNEKLHSAFDFLPESIFQSNINIVDWGCGQGLATLSYFDYFNSSKYVDQVILIEPSEIALKRGALHVSQFISASKIVTINKDLDSLTIEDLFVDRSNVNLHLFSNILDVELFSLTHLLDLISSSYPGENYFVCLSPFITSTKSARIDSFVNYFKNYPEFELIEAIDNQKGTWKNGWSRLLRVFKVLIN